MSAPTIDVVDAGPVRVVTLSQPQKKNALTPAMLRALAAALPTAPASPSQTTRVVVVEGAGGTFSSGFDLSAIEGERDSGVDPITPAADAIQSCSVPVIAAVDGSCFGGAVELLAACHLRVAASSSSFCVPAVKIGLVYPASGLRRFRRVLGGNAERVLLTGDVFGAQQAQAWGLVHDVVDDARVHARAMATRIAENAPLAVSGTLRALRLQDEGAAEADVEAVRALALSSADLVEGLLAKKEKRPPKFEGR